MTRIAPGKPQSTSKEAIGREGLRALAASIAQDDVSVDDVGDAQRLGAALQIRYDGRISQPIAAPQKENVLPGCRSHADIESIVGSHIGTGMHLCEHIGM